MPGRKRGAAISGTLAGLILAAQAVFSPVPARSDIQPLRSSDEATLLIGVDSARVSVLTVLATPPTSGRDGSVEKPRRLIGTGIVLGPRRVLTSASMALPGGAFSVLLSGEERRAARLRGVDRQSNIALFEVDGAPLRPLRQASPQSVAVGSWVAVISNVSVSRPQITLGQVVGRGERVDFPYPGDIVEIEATTYPGASGGAVLNELGEWVAIVVGRAGPNPRAPSGPTAAAPNDAGRGSDPTDLLVALPIDQVRRITEDLEAYGSVRRGFLGIQLQRGAMVDSLGVLVEGVVPGSPAEAAGIRVGDRILAFEGSVVRSSEEITSLVRSLKPGDEVELTISRSSEIFPLRAVLAAAVGPPAAPTPPGGAAELGKLKRELRKLEAETKRLEDKIKSMEAPPQR